MVRRVSPVVGETAGWRGGRAGRVGSTIPTIETLVKFRISQTTEPRIRGTRWNRGQSFLPAGAMTAQNAVTRVEVDASRRLLEQMRPRPGGGRMEQVMWAASGSEAIQKALWAALARDRTRPMILATRFGFHGKKGLANAVTGSEADAERDPRVRFISFPMAECRDVANRTDPFDPAPYRAELD